MYSGRSNKTVQQHQEDVKTCSSSDQSLNHKTLYQKTLALSSVFFLEGERIHQIQPKFDFLILAFLVLVARHFSKCLVQLIRDGFELFFFVEQFILESVNFLLQFYYRPFGKFGSCLGLFKFGVEMFNLFFVMLLSLVGFFFGYFKRFEIVSDNS